MPDTEFSVLVEDIRKNGQKEAVILLGDEVLDGWHRYLACRKAGVKCVTAKHDGSDPVAFVLSRNLHRRHLTASQRAAAIVAAANWKPPGKPAPGAGLKDAEPGSPNPAPSAGLSEAEMAKAAEVSERTIRHAKAAQRNGLGDKVRDGALSAKAAATPSKPANSPPKAPGHVEKLEAKVSELTEALKEAAAEIERLSAVEQGEEAALIKKLQAELSAVTATRDTVMRENVELKRQVKMLERKAK